MKKIFVQINGVKSGPFKLYEATESYFMYGDLIVELDPLLEMGAQITNYVEPVRFDGVAYCGGSQEEVDSFIRSNPGKKFKLTMVEMVR